MTSIGRTTLKKGDTVFVKSGENPALPYVAQVSCPTPRPCRNPKKKYRLPLAERLRKTFAVRSLQSFR